MLLQHHFDSFFLVHSRASLAAAFGVDGQGHRIK